MYQTVTTSIKREIESIKACALTMDGWVSSQHFGYMSLTLHLVNETFKLITRTLTIQNVTGSLTGQAIKDAIEELLEQWGIMRKAECITTGNGFKFN